VVLFSAGLSELNGLITVDACGTDECALSLDASSGEVRVPCPATALDLPVEVLAFGAEGDVCRGLVGRCGREDGGIAVMSHLDVDSVSGTVGAWLRPRCRSWLGPALFSSSRPTGWRWAER